MSIYEDYQTTSQSYDSTRVPVGIELVFGCLETLGRPMAELTVLDAGCGTGNYSQILVERVGRMEAVELNAGMIEQAKAKLASEVEAGRIRFQQASIDALPLEDQSVDAIVINQVIHHLEDEGEMGFPRHEQVFREFARVVKPDGMLLINTCSREQLRKGYWYYDLIPQAVEKLALKYIEMDDLKALLSKCGFECGERYVPLDAVLQAEAYFQPEGLLDPNCRAGDSTFALLNEKELQEMESTLRSMKAANTLDAYFREKDASRPTVGQSMFVCARRS